MLADLDFNEDELGKVFKVFQEISEDQPNFQSLLNMILSKLQDTKIQADFKKR